MRRPANKRDGIVAVFMMKEMTLDMVNSMSVSLPERNIRKVCWV